MGTRIKHDGAGKSRKGTKSDLINFDQKNETIPLKQEAPVRKSGGLFISPNGVKVEVPPGASTGRRERILCAPVPSTARGLLGPWLGPNLRMASDIQLFYSPQNFRHPVAIFIPFSYAAARELAYPLGNDSGQIEDGKTKGDPTEGDSTLQSESSAARIQKGSGKGKAGTIMSTYFNQKTRKSPPLLDTRNVFLLSCKLGEEQWDTVENFTIIQPTVHHSHWPPDIKRLVVQSARWPDQTYAEVPAATTTATITNATNVNTGGDSTNPAKRMSNTAARGRRNSTHPLKDSEPLNQIRRIENYCGGVCIATEQLNHCFLIVIGTKTENFQINRDGGLFRSPLLHPFLSIRIPKRSCLENVVGCFKAIEIRPNCMQAAAQFDSQLVEVEGCSDIYELDVQNIQLRRSATVRLPLPQWFVDRQSRSHDTWDQNSTTVDSSEHQEPSAVSRTGASDGNFNYERSLTVLYQAPGHKRQIIWQPANTDDTREEVVRRKSRLQISRKDTATPEKCKLDNLYCRLGWSYLTVGIRGGPWSTMKEAIYFTKRTAFFESNILGRFVLIGARDPERTPASKLAHLMSRVEALTIAPPGALLVFLQVQPTCWKIMANIYPEERLPDVIQTKVTAGFIPLVQMAGGNIRRTTCLCNAVLQASEIIQLPKEAADLEKNRKRPQIRFNGVDVVHVLMYNGLCLELRITGDVRLKPVNQFEAFTQVMKNVKSPEPEADPRDLVRCEPSMSTLGVPPPPPVRRDIPTLLTTCAYTQHHELLHETSCLVEIEPVSTEEPKFIKKCIEKAQIVTEMLKATAKKQSNASDDEDDDGQDLNDSDNEDDGLRRSSHSDTQTSTTYEDDDGEFDVLTREAQEQVMKDRPLSAAAVNAELCRRLGNVVEKNKIRRSTEFLQKLHDIYHVGTVEVWLAPPQTLPQLSLPKDQQNETRERSEKPSAVTDDAPISSRSENSGVQRKAETAAAAHDESNTENAEQQEEKLAFAASQSAVEYDGRNDQNDSNRETHNAIRWNPVESTAGTDGKSSMLLMNRPNKPLVIYNILVDPDVAMNYLRMPAGKNTISSVVLKKSSKRNSGQRGRLVQERQRNVNAMNKISASQTSTFSEPCEPDTLIPVSQAKDDTAANSQLSLLDQLNMHSLAYLISEPLQLAEALGLPEEELNRVRTMMTGKDFDRPSNQLVYEVIRTWKKCYLTHRLPLRCVSARGGDNNTNEADNAVRASMTDLVDVFHSLGYFEAAELVGQIMNAGLPKKQGIA
ncbi:uncharacterized protein DEA37_0007472 [Paragonimus westermani]|uniref:Death domain-containing protein n=1 Tax=Paragonimus westermani TaxID=34504 RepID=A0A5J4NK99_9TREM|nr:uncharacterized protein DEA37_0007472 [Paragonimus westermani]